MSAATGKMLETVGTYIFFVVLGSFAVWVFYIFFTNISVLKGEDHLYVAKEVKV